MNLRPAVYAAVAAVLSMTSGTTLANHGAAGDPNLRVDAVAVDDPAKQGACTTVRVQVRNTSSQVSVQGPWRTRLDTVTPDGTRVATTSIDRDGLGHRWESQGGGLPDTVTVVFANVEFPAPGDYVVRASVSLLSATEKEYAGHDNTAEIATNVAAECAPGGAGPGT